MNPFPKAFFSVIVKKFSTLQGIKMILTKNKERGGNVSPLIALYDFFVAHANSTSLRLAIETGRLLYFGTCRSFEPATSAHDFRATFITL